MNTAIIMDMMFNTEMIVKDMKGGKEDMTEKRLFVGKKKAEDRFTIITTDGEIGVKENRSGDVLVLMHDDLNAQQFVAQLVVFLNDQNQAIVDLYDCSKYWSDKATERIKELEKENGQLKKSISKMDFILDDLNGQEYISRDDAVKALNKIDKEVCKWIKQWEKGE